MHAVFLNNDATRNKIIYILVEFIRNSEIMTLKIAWGNIKSSNYTDISLCTNIEALFIIPNT